MSDNFLPYARQQISDADIEAVTRVLRSNFLTTGPAVSAFEEKLAEVADAAFAVSCSSGTAALHMAALALGLGQGDKVVVPTVTFLATANAARYVGAEVVFADVDADTGLIGPEQFSDALKRGGEDIKAVFPVHLAGQSPDMTAITTMARERGIAIIEDACHALGSTVQSGNVTTPVGSCLNSEMAAFSFHPVKTIAMGEGGAVTTNDAALAGRLKLMRSHGMIRQKGQAEPWAYKMAEPGFNYRASDIHCALGLSQLSRISDLADKRRLLVQSYDKALAPLAPVIKPLSRMPGNPVWHLYVVLIDFKLAGIDRATVMNRLHDEGIGSQVHYIPVDSQPYYRERYGETSLPGARAYYDRCLSLPLFASMTEKDVSRVVDALERLLHH